ncbi:MAG: M20/M25/M40 family metallo-hydrolase [Bryobacteraceae bacterium]
MQKLLAVVLLGVSLSPAAEIIDDSANWKIRREATNHSQIMRILHVLTDRYGPRLTGSSNHVDAANWAAVQMTDWGLKNAHLEPWKVGHPGWANQRASGYLISPVKDNLTLEVLAWTPSTNGAVAASIVQLTPPLESTKEELTAWLDANNDRVKGKIVMLGKAAVIPIAFNPVTKRVDDSEMKARVDPINPAPMFPGRARSATAPTGNLTADDREQMLNTWLVTNRALLRIVDAARELGQIRALHNSTFDVSRSVPAVALRNEDYGRIQRLLADALDVQAQFDIVNRSYPEGETSYNVVAEIPGSDKAAEVVMLGAHLDSWHPATGATDNAIGCATMMEAARIIQSLGLKPRRTIRVALWSGEEQGLLGSLAYVKEHFGTFEDPRPEFPSLVAYFNADLGTGRVRGAAVFGPAEAATVVREALAPFEDLGLLGATASKSRDAVGTDSFSFNGAGLAGIIMMQDPIEYFAASWHSNLDTYERIIPDDAVKSSIAIAAAVWHIANRDEPLPRFSPETMPPPTKAPAK